jgi:hypothetical protein
MPDAPATIPCDLPCSGCGYNLRALHVAGACPECGRAILPTLLSRGHLPGAASLRARSWGSALIGAAVLAGGACAVAAGFNSHGPWLLVALSVAFIAGAVGTWGFAAPAPGPTRRRDYIGVAARIAAVVACTLQLQALVCVAFLIQLPQSIALLLLQMTLLVWIAAALLTCARAAGLAREVGDVPGLTQACLIAAISTIVLALLATQRWDSLTHTSRCALIAAALIDCVWSGVFFLGFARVLRRSASAGAISDRHAYTI